MDATYISLMDQLVAPLCGPNQAVSKSSAFWAFYSSWFQSGHTPGCLSEHVEAAIANLSLPSSGGAFLH